MNWTWAKKWPRTVEERRRWIDPSDRRLSIRWQCELLGLHRSNMCYESVREPAANAPGGQGVPAASLLGKLQDGAVAGDSGRDGQPEESPAIATKHWDLGCLPGPRTTVRSTDHKVYPCLLRDIETTRPNQVWASEITHVPMQRGCLYLTAVMDWFSRCVLSWRLSNSMDVELCLSGLEEALHHGRPEIFNTDQRSQFISRGFTGRLTVQLIAISMEARGGRSTT